MGRFKKISSLILSCVFAASFSVVAFADVETSDKETSSVTIFDESGVDPRDAGAVAFAVTGDEIKAASVNSDFTLYLKFKTATPFSIKAYVKLKSGVEKLYVIEGGGKNAESWFPMQDMLDSLHITVDEIDVIDFDGDANFKGASFVNTNVTSDKDDNPATGVSLAIIPALASCTAMMFLRKRK